jgi:hydroxyacylglutathione hydrolase
MLLKYFYDNKLAHASYLVGCQATGEAAVVDPARDVSQYIQAAEENGMKIVAAIETHIHADYVSGIRELAHRKGAKLYVSGEGGPDWSYPYVAQYDHQILKHGDTWKIGNIIFEAMHTPGHTPEHMSYMITDSAGADKPMGVFTGDFIFVGDVGRPDLLEEAAGIKDTKLEAAHQMYQSIQAFKEQPDYLQIWPAHGAGSACGKSLGAVPSSTLGYEKMFNWAFSYDDESRFIDILLSDQPAPPAYFAQMKRINREGPALMDNLSDVIHLDYKDFSTLLSEKQWIVDTRSQEEYVKRHIVGTVGIPQNDKFTSYSGWVLPYDKPVYLIVEQAKLDEALYDLRYIGIDSVAGYVAPDIMEKVATESQHVNLITPDEIADKVKNKQVQIIDVRNDQEYDAGHIPAALNISLGELEAKYNQIPESDQEKLVVCRSGGRSFVAATMLRKHGFKNVMNLAGGMQAWSAKQLPVNTKADLHHAA